MMATLRLGDMRKVKDMLWGIGITNDNYPNNKAATNCNTLCELLLAAKNLEADRKLDGDIARFLIAKLARYVDMTQVICAVAEINPEVAGTIEIYHLPNKAFRNIKKGRPDDETNTVITRLTKRQFIALLNYLYHYKHYGELHRAFNKPILMYIYQYKYLNRAELFRKMAEAFDCSFLLDDLAERVS